ncbi:family 78 glycoside hydrolase catalytic domain [Pedobacter sp. MC2016-05]|uniref:family 78 glycoside hydrolase catalytic domain n=1 Tax=Pedobacter sp. MC2016-05 TaxID=2994474 RepID=UPI002248145B|nr:family 78 glycoside hydrolase catalytic domain [Pedobacter sp. MC2016-05]MCX2476633.1 family 78 glycoside hydrolase catalytic domain [Pedobacter sp. MC2016-05]
MSKLFIFSWLFLFSFSLYAEEITVARLSLGYRNNPIGVDFTSPSLSWKLQSDQRNVTQAAYQVLVSSSITKLNQNIGDVWDTRKVNSAQSIQIEYQGAKLLSTKTYYWKVKVWDNFGNVSPWSATAYWQMGLLNIEDWKGAKWIAYEKLADSNINVLPVDGKKDKYNGTNVLPMFRKDFFVTKTIKKATAFISGLGHFEMSLNGEKVGDDFLAPGWTKYDKEALYVTYDVTKQIKKGQNAVGVMLGNGFYYVPPVKERYRKLKVAYGYPKVICRVLVEYTDGTSANIISNQSWRTAPSPVTFSSIYGGEDYNANLEQKNWNVAGFDDQQWKSALLVDGPKLNAQNEDPVKVFEYTSSIKTTRVPNGEWVYDMRQNSSSIIELKVRGKKGDTIRITPAELIKEDGSVTQKNIGGPSYFTYILKGDGIEIWRPKFFYTGFRYLQVKGANPFYTENDPNKTAILNIRAYHVRNAAEQVGEFNTSNDLFNKTFKLIDWSIKSNMVSVFTDCPHREKLGWLEQLHLMGNSVGYNYAAAPLFKKALEDMRNSQLPNGLIPEIAPEYVKFEWGGDMFRDSPEWGSSGILLPWYLYQWYGDKQAMIDYYPMMQGYINYLATKANNHILSQGLGDWYDLGPKPPGVSQLTPMGVTGTAIYYYDLKILEKMAILLGKKADALSYSKLAVEVRKSFNDKFFDPKTKQYATGSQAANAMAIYMGLVADQDKKAVIDNLVKDIRDRKNSLTAGDIGYRYVLRVLEEAGRSDVIFDMNSRSDVPGYGMQIAKGATALTESWAALPTVSNNHFMLGHLMEWLYSGIGGIRQAEHSVAFKHIVIEPEVVGDLTSANVSYDSPYGKIATQWNKIDKNFTIEVNIPVNTKADIYFPGKTKQTITDELNPKMNALSFENGKAKITIGSGHYKFICTNE